MKTVIFGTSNLAHLLYYFATEDSNIEIDGFVVDTKYIDTAPKMPCDVIPYEEIQKHANDYIVLSSVGYYDMNMRRRHVFERLKKDGFIIGSYIHPTAHIAKNAVIGQGNIIMENATIQPFTRIGDCNFFFENTCISHHSTVGSFNWFAPGASTGGEVTIGDLSFFGINCTVKSEITVSNSTLVGAGAYCAMDTIEHQVVKALKSEYTISKAFSKF